MNNLYNYKMIIYTIYIFFLKYMMNILSSEIITEMLSHWGDLDLEIICAVDKFINIICEDDYVFLLKIEKKYGTDMLTQKMTNEGYKEFYYRLKYKNINFISASVEKIIKLHTFIKDSLLNNYEIEMEIFETINLSISSIEKFEDYSNVYKIIFNFTFDGEYFTTELYYNYNTLEFIFNLTWISNSGILLMNLFYYYRYIDNTEYNSSTLDQILNNHEVMLFKNDSLSYSDKNYLTSMTLSIFHRTGEIPSSFEMYSIYKKYT